MSEKTEVLEMVQGLPEGATFGEILESIAVLTANRRGKAAGAIGQVRYPLRGLGVRYDRPFEPLDIEDRDAPR